MAHHVYHRGASDLASDHYVSSRKMCHAIDRAQAHFRAAYLALR
jgi:hypothetical protein